MKDIYDELNTSKVNLDEMQRTQESKLQRTKNMKEAIEKEVVDLSNAKLKLQENKAKLEQEIGKLKRLLKEDKDELQIEYDQKVNIIKEKIDKLQTEVQNYKSMCRQVVGLCEDRMYKKTAKVDHA